MILMRQRIRFCSTADGLRLAFADSGSGPPLVRVANWFTHLNYDWQSPVWRHWFTMLSEGRTLLRYDPRGSGLSDRDTDDFSLDRWIVDLEAVVATAGLNRFPLIGFCQGGVAAAAYAARHPEQVTHLVLYDCYSHGAYVDGAPGSIAREARVLAEMIEVGWGKDNGAFRELFANLLMPEAGEDAVKWIGEMQRRSTSSRNARLMWDAFQTFDIRQIAQDINAPTMVFHGRRTAMVPFEAGRQLATLIPNAQFMPLETNNHILVPTEPAWTIFRRELMRFLPTESEADISVDNAIDTLTRRETEILNAVARGLNNREVADLFRISEKTVRNHLTAIFSKLGTPSRARAIVSARDAGLGLADWDKRP
jgi:pimeloyl-ACP methyl ester carboxylesterase/DNA-binding CsgD family transcriptional regulator